MMVDLFLNRKYLECGLSKYIVWDYERFPHMVIFGATGSGKTYALKLILARLAKYVPNSQLVICDYKSDRDFSFLAEKNNFYCFEECSHGLQWTVDELKRRQSGSGKQNYVCLVFDEWASYLNNKEKKESELEKQKLSMLLMLGRSFNIHVIVSQQRVDAMYFGNARDNFSIVIGLGTLSKEAVQMMFSEYRDTIETQKSRGQGSAIMGNTLQEIIVPEIRDMQKLHYYIGQAVSRMEDNQPQNGGAEQ